MPLMLEPYPTWNYQETMYRIGNIESQKLKMFARIGYLLGGRLSELLELSPDKISIDEGLIFATLRTRKVRKKSWRELINVIEDEPFYTNQLIHFKEKDYDTIQNYVTFKRTWLEKNLRKELGTVPHGLRHLRATHMGKQLIPSKIHQATAPYLKNYFGWEKLETASFYIDKLTTSEIIQHYRKQTQDASIPQ